MGGYSLLLAWQRSETPVAGPAPAEDLLEEPRPPLPLPRIRTTVEAAGGSVEEARQVELRVRINGSARSGAPLGVAIFDGRDGLPLGYRAVDLSELPLEVTFTDIPEGDQLVCLVRSAALAKNSYLDRTSVAVSGDGPVTATTLSARLQDVRIQLLRRDDQGLVANTLHQLTRVDDPHWRPPLPVTADALEDPMLMTDADGRLHLTELGPGHYRLELLGLPAERGLEPEAFEFRVPGPNQLEFICRRR